MLQLVFKAFLASSAQIWINQYPRESSVAFDMPCCRLGLPKETIKSQSDKERVTAMQLRRSFPCCPT